MRHVHPRLMRLRWQGAAGAILIAALGVVTAAYGQDREAMRRELEQVKHDLERLTTRLGQLEQQLATPAVTPPAAPPAVVQAPPAAAAEMPPAAPMDEHQLRDRWRGVHHGMMTGEVETLLGHPHRTIALTARTVWHYSYGDVGNASVVFAADGTVMDWQSPFNSWW